MIIQEIIFLYVSVITNIHQIGLTLNKLNKALKSVTQKEITWPDNIKYNWDLLTFEDIIKENDRTLKIGYK